jgi:hypothetical protein
VEFLVVPPVSSYVAPSYDSEVPSREGGNQGEAPDVWIYSEAGDDRPSLQDNICPRNSGVSEGLTLLMM